MNRAKYHLILQVFVRYRLEEASITEALLLKTFIQIQEIILLSLNPNTLPKILLQTKLKMWSKWEVRKKWIGNFWPLLRSGQIRLGKGFNQVRAIGGMTTETTNLNNQQALTIPLALSLINLIQKTHIIWINIILTRAIGAKSIFGTKQDMTKFMDPKHMNINITVKIIIVFKHHQPVFRRKIKQL